MNEEIGVGRRSEDAEAELVFSSSIIKGCVVFVSFSLLASSSRGGFLTGVMSSFMSAAWTSCFCLFLSGRFASREH